MPARPAVRGRAVEARSRRLCRYTRPIKPCLPDLAACRTPASWAVLAAWRVLVAWPLPVACRSQCLIRAALCLR